MHKYLTPSQKRVRVTEDDSPPKEDVKKHKMIKPDGMSDDNFALLKFIKTELKDHHADIRDVKTEIGGVKTDVSNLTKDVVELRKELDKQKTKLEHMEKAGPADLDFRAYLNDLRKEIDAYVVTIHVYDVPANKDLDWVRSQGIKLKMPKDLKDEIKAASILRKGDNQNRQKETCQSYWIKMPSIRSRIRVCKAAKGRPGGARWDKIVPRPFRAADKVLTAARWKITVMMHLTCMLEFRKDCKYILYTKKPSRSADRYPLATFTPPIPSGDDSSRDEQPLLEENLVWHTDANKELLKSLSARIIISGKPPKTKEEVEAKLKQLMTDEHFALIIELDVTQWVTVLIMRTPEDVQTIMEAYSSDDHSPKDWSWAIFSI